MVRFEADQKFSMDEALDSLKPFEDKIDPEVFEFAYNTISEIDGFPDGYLEVLRLAKQEVSQDVFINYMMH